MFIFSQCAHWKNWNISSGCFVCARQALVRLRCCRRTRSTCVRVRVNCSLPFWYVQHAGWTECTWCEVYGFPSRQANINEYDILFYLSGKYKHREICYARIAPQFGLNARIGKIYLAMRALHRIWSQMRAFHLSCGHMRALGKYKHPGLRFGFVCA